MEHISMRSGRFWIPYEVLFIDLPIMQVKKKLTSTGTQFHRRLSVICTI